MFMQAVRTMTELLQMNGKRILQLMQISPNLATVIHEQVGQEIYVEYVMYVHIC